MYPKRLMGQCDCLRKLTLGVSTEEVLPIPERDTKLSHPSHRSL